MKKALLVISLLVFSVTAVQAAPVTGVTATTTMGNGFGSDIGHIVDGSGLSAQQTSATHAIATPENAWAGTVATGTVTFDLGGLFNIDGMAVWNFNADNRASVQNLTILSSLDGVNFSPVAGAPNIFAQGANSSPELAELFSFSVTATSVRFDITSNYSFPGSTGLSEVMFTGTPAAPVPEPTTMLLLGFGLVGLAGYGRKKFFKK